MPDDWAVREDELDRQHRANRERAVYKGMLQAALRGIREHDQDYDVRYQLVLDALSLANRLGMKAGIRLDPNEPGWPVAFIELPTGQVSWHIPQHPVAWDGHSTEEKFRRIDEYAPPPTGIESLATEYAAPAPSTP